MLSTASENILPSEAMVTIVSASTPAKGTEADDQGEDRGHHQRLVGADDVEEGAREVVDRRPVAGCGPVMLLAARKLSGAATIVPIVVASRAMKIVTNMALITSLQGLAGRGAADGSERLDLQAAGIAILGGGDRASLDFAGNEPWASVWVCARSVSVSRRQAPAHARRCCLAARSMPLDAEGLTWLRTHGLVQLTDGPLVAGYASGSATAARDGEGAISMQRDLRLAFDQIGPQKVAEDLLALGAATISLRKSGWVTRQLRP